MNLKQSLGAIMNFGLRDEDLKALRDAAGGDLAEAVLRDVRV